MAEEIWANCRQWSKDAGLNRFNMCGITGGIGPSAPRQVLLDAQLKSIEHRGPDEKGTYVSYGIGIGMCRLAIVEIATGKQPATDLTGLIHVVWNGEIYNYRELRDELAIHGIYCRDSSESEVILNLFLVFGLEFIKKLNGMFAIAIHDARDNSLHLIRDQLGKKPLWVSQLNDGTLFFASEVRALLLAQTNRTLRAESIAEVMQYGYIKAPNSAFKEIYQVPPASVTSWCDSKTTTSFYWSPDFETKVTIKYEQALETTKLLIQDAISRRLISERPLGSFLSGGYDSTVITALMSGLMNRNVDTFTIGFNQPDFDEAAHAKKISNYLGTNHHELYLNPDPAEVVESLSKILDQPFADSSIIPTYLLSKFARENVVVALGGDGGDEVFGGYERYLVAPVLQNLNSILNLARIALPFAKTFVNHNPRKFKKLKNQLLPSNSLASRYSSILSLAQPADIISLLEREFQTDIASRLFETEFNLGNISDLSRMVRSDLQSYLPGDLLVKADIATMANSLELRSPLLDVNVIEWGLSLPDRFKVGNGETKHILKDIARSLVPPELINRPKMGFAIPRADWLRTNLREISHDTLLDKTAQTRGWFRHNEVKKVLDLHTRGDDMDHIIWPMLTLELWARSWLD